MAGIYIHIPFCHSKCAYCDFYSMPNTRYDEEYVQALIVEWQIRRYEVSGPFETVYIGGGTPSILAPAQLQRIIEVLPTQGLREFTLEANPEDVTLDKVMAWRDMGINRISMGIQSLDDECLKRIGRRHDSVTALRAVETLQDAGITEISLDVIYGLPGQDLDSWRTTLDTLIKRRPQHLSAYALSVEPGTRLYSAATAGKWIPADDETYARMYDILCEDTAHAGYTHYEISNFALPGHSAIHNSHYWDMTPYIGLGPGAHSWDGRTRRVNAPDLTQYLINLAARHTAYDTEAESDADRVNDMIFTALRTDKGLDIQRLPEPFRHEFESLAAHCCDLIHNEATVRIPQNKWLVSDAIIRDLLVGQ
mgnify:CR=1 FL=1